MIEEDSWIFKATCLHFATKFNTSGLNIILDYFDTKEKQDLINQTHGEHMISPLHVASLSSSKALATRYQYQSNSI